MKTINGAILLAGFAVMLQSCGDGRPANDGVKDPAHDELNNSGDLNNESNLGDDAHFFMNEAAIGGIYELKLSRYVAEQASSKEVRETAAQIAADHQQINEELVQLAKSKNVLLPNELPLEKQRKMDEMMKLKGSALDKAYLEEMKNLHQKDVATFEKASKSQKNVKVRKFAEAKVSVLRSHLEMVAGN